MTKAYLIGALHDGTERKTTYRIVANDLDFILFLQRGIESLGRNAWIYQEGKNRNLFVVEFSKTLLINFKLQTKSDIIYYLRGYFDTDGGISRNPKVRYYIYFAQKNLDDLKQAKEYLEDLGIETGSIHNPSAKIDPNYWRFFIRVKSYSKFAKVIGSWHPIKSKYLKDEDIVHASSNGRKSMNKVSLAEAGDGSPPF